MNIAIVDDALNDSSNLKILLKRYQAEHSRDISVSCFSSAEEFFKTYVPLSYTVIFMDIYMSGMSGLESASLLRARNDTALIVMLTSSMEHMQEAFRFHAFDYVEKPADPDRIFSLLDYVFNRLEPERKAISFQSDKAEYSLTFDDVVSVSASNHYLNITDKNGVTYKTRMTFSAAEELLSADARFLTIIRGIIVNMDHILDIGNGVCRLKGGQSFPVSLRRSKQIETVWKNYIFSCIRDETVRERKDS